MYTVVYGRFVYTEFFSAHNTHLSARFLLPKFLSVTPQMWASRSYQAISYYRGQLLLYPALTPFGRLCPPVQAQLTLI